MTHDQAQAAAAGAMSFQLVLPAGTT